MIKPPIDKSLMLAIAYLRSGGAPQLKISTELGISQSCVSRLLRVAEEEGILDPGPTFRLAEKDQQEWLQAKERYFGHANLHKALVASIRTKQHFRLTVLTGGFEQFTLAAGHHVLQLLKGSRRIGVMWGRTVSKLIEGMKRATPKADTPQFGAVDSIPLCGDPVHLMNQQEVEHSAS